MVYGEGRRGGWITGSWKVSVVERKSSISSVSGTELYFSVGNLNMTLLVYLGNHINCLKESGGFVLGERSAVQNFSNVEADTQEYFFNRIQDFVLDQKGACFSYLSATEGCVLISFRK